MSTPQGVFEVKCSIRNNDLATSRGSQLQNMGMHREKWCYLTMNNGGLTMKNVVLIKKINQWIPDVGWCGHWRWYVESTFRKVMVNHQGFDSLWLIKYWKNPNMQGKHRIIRGKHAPRSAATAHRVPPGTITDLGMLGRIPRLGYTTTMQCYD